MNFSLSILSNIYQSWPSHITGRQRKNNFFRFICYVKPNRVYALSALAGIILQFILFKWAYPYADFFSDSYSYLYAASAHLNVNIWPIGYSKFLTGFHLLTTSDTALVGFQYGFFELSALYFFFTTLYFYRPVKNTTIILYLFLFFNPLFAYLCNYVNSDPLFAALSLCWLTELIWIMNRPRLYHVVTQALLLFLAFTVRNNAYYYPLIGALAFILSSRRAWFEWMGGLAGLLLIIPFVIYTRDLTKKMTDTAQFSLFTGWQLANNALYMYPSLNVNTKDFPTAECRELDELSKRFYTHIIPDFQDVLSAYTGNFFIRQSEAPLKQYLYSHYRITDGYSGIVAWGQASAVFDVYGSWLIKHYPVSYIRTYVWLNTKNYFLPPLEKLGVYNLGMDSISPIAKDWFQYKSLAVRSASKDLQGVLLYAYPAFFGLLNLYFLGSVGLFVARKRYKDTGPKLNRILLLTGIFWFANFFFCISVTIIVFRYEIVPMIFTFAATLLLLELQPAHRIRKS